MRTTIYLTTLLLGIPIFLSAQISMKNVKAPETITVSGKVYDQV